MKRMIGDIFISYNINLKKYNLKICDNNFKWVIEVWNVQVLKEVCIVRLLRF